MAIIEILKKDWNTVLSEPARLVLLGSGIVGVSLILSWGFRTHATDLSRDWTRMLPFSDTTAVMAVASDSLLASAGGTPAQVGRLREQMRIIAVRAHLHLDIMEYFFGRYFASVTMASILAVAAGLCLFHITKAGWANANRYVMTAFVISAGLGILWQISPRLFRQEENIARNKELYLGYVALSGRIRTSLASGALTAPDSEGLAGLLLQVEQELLNLRDLPIGFDEAQVPRYGAISALDKKE